MSCHPELTRKSVEFTKLDFLFLLGDSGSIPLMGKSAIIDSGSESGMTVKKCKNACHPEQSEGTTHVDMLPTHAKETSTTDEGAVANSSCPPLVGDRNLRFRGGQLFERDSSVVPLPQNDCKVVLDRDFSQTSFAQNHGGKSKKSCHPEALAEGSLTNVITPHLEIKNFGPPTRGGHACSCHPEHSAEQNNPVNCFARGEEGSLTRFDKDSSQIAFAQNDCKKKKAGFTLAEGATHVDLPPTLAKAGFTLAESATHVGTPPTLAKAGFTLAEVLITLGIIGVVAVMTIPNLISNIADLQYRTAHKKVRMDIEQACRRLASDGELIEANDSEDFVKNYLSKYVKVIQTCDNNNLEKCGIVAGANKIHIVNEKDLAQSPIFATMPKIMSDIVSEGKYIDKSSKSYGFVFGNGYAANLFYNKNCQDIYILNNRDFSSYIQDFVCVNVIFDTNGLASPNVTGKDISFVTVFYPDTNSITVAPDVYRANTLLGPREMGSELCAKLCKNCVPLSFEDYGAMVFNNFMYPPRLGSTYHLATPKGFATTVTYSGYLAAYPGSQSRPFRCKVKP